MVEDDKDEESYASKFFDSMINDDVDDSGTKIETESHKEYLEKVNDDDEEIEKKMKDDKIDKGETNDNVEKTNVVVKEKDNDEGTDIAKISRKRSKPDNHGHGNGIECAKSGRMLSKLRSEGASGSMEFRNEKMQTPIPTPTRSPRKDLSSDKTISNELTATVSPTTATTFKDSSTSKRKKQPISYDDIK
ncbi:hypothetical protein Tco_0622969 [Tanacetum coccineum]